MPLKKTSLAVALALSLLAGGAQAQTAPAPAASPAEIEFWSTVKDSKNAAELKAYLDTYPNGTYAALARVRIKALEDAASKPAAPAPAPALAAPKTPPAPPPASPTASALTSPDAIREVQAKLYNLNYEVGPQNGQLTNETRAAIRRWQANVSRAETGDMTSADMALLRSASVPTTWGAVAYNVEGGSSSVWNRASRQDAEAASLAECRKLRGGDCNVVTAVNAGCGAVSYASGTVGSTRYRGAYAVVRATQAQAIDVALSDCRTRSKVPNNCGIRTTFCADGAHKR